METSGGMGAKFPFGSKLGQCTRLCPTIFSGSDATDLIKTMSLDRLYSEVSALYVALHPRITKLILVSLILPSQD